jgi:hypothetical protein
MNKVITSFLLFFPILSIAQVEVNLSVFQPPEFGIEVSSTDTLVVMGNSVDLGKNIEVFGGTGRYDFTWAPSENLSDSKNLRAIAKPSVTTIYYLTVSDGNDCSFTVDYTINVDEVGVGVDETTNENQTIEILLYPNPNIGFFKVQINGLPSEKLELSIFNSQGRFILNKKITQFTGSYTEVISSKLNPGSYFLKVNYQKEQIQRSFIIH